MKLRLEIVVLYCVAAAGTVVQQLSENICFPTTTFPFSGNQINLLRENSIDKRLPPQKKKLHVYV